MIEPTSLSTTEAHRPGADADDGAASRAPTPSIAGALRGLARLLCWVIVFPVALALGLVSSLPALVRAALTLALAALSLGWTAILLVLHIASVILYTVGLTHQRKVLLTREGVNRLLRELRADLADLAVVPRCVARHTGRALKRGKALVDRLVKTSRVRSSELLATLGKRLHPQQLDFEDRYAILEPLPSGGSTARLFVVRELVNGAPAGDRLVLKHFSLDGGSHLENIVRESAAVKLATRLGIVRDSRMTRTSFYYVMPYYAGNTLTREVLALHRSLPDGAAPGAAEQLRFLRWMQDLLVVIVAYHERGVFHKDIKPDNLIASGERLHLVDIGLLTPLESTLQLTTHGTEYFRDPEMVKLAVRGVAIRDVDCPKFDIYSMGAVLFFLLEGEFPSLGSLSQHRKRTPLCLQWIATRAMADFDKRYASAREMQADVERLLELAVSQPLEQVTVACLPSFQTVAETTPVAPAPVEPPAVAVQPQPVLAIPTAPVKPARRGWLGWAAAGAVLAGVAGTLAWREFERAAASAAFEGVATEAATFFENPHNREAIGEFLGELDILGTGRDPSEPAGARTTRPDLADVARSVYRTGRTVHDWWQAQQKDDARKLAQRGLLLDGQGRALPLRLAVEDGTGVSARLPHREAAARHIARLAASFRQTVLAALPPPPERREDRLRLPVLVVPLADAAGDAMDALKKEVKLALAAECIPFEPDADSAGLHRLRDELRGLVWPAALGQGGALEQLLTARAGDAAETPCVLGLELRGAADDPRRDEARVLLCHPQGCAERAVRWER